VRLTVVDASRILDMRNAQDQHVWNESGLEALRSRPDFPMLARRAGVSGIYDRSFGGLAIYDAKAVQVVGVVPEPVRESSTPSAPSPRP
jgi:hypothetical protein